MKAIFTFIAITLGLSISLSLIVGLTGGHESPYINLGFISMLIPAIGVLIARVSMHEEPLMNGKSFSVGYLPFALLLMPVVMHAVMFSLTIEWEGSLNWQDWLSPHANGLYYSPPERGWGILTKGELIAAIAGNAVVGLLVVSAFAFFEEIGWRAWLLPRFLEMMSIRNAIISVSIIWALWHVPYSVSEIQYIGRPSSLLTVSVTTFGVFSSGLIIGWFWLRTKSIWIVSIAHGALNNWGQYAFKYLDDFKIADDVFVLGSGGVALFLLGIILLWFFLPEKSP